MKVISGKSKSMDAMPAKRIVYKNVETNFGIFGGSRRDLKSKGCGKVGFGVKNRILYGGRKEDLVKWGLRYGEK